MVMDAVARRLRALNSHTVCTAPVYKIESDSDQLRAALREHLPIPVDAESGMPDPAALSDIRRAMHDAAAREDYRLATGFSELLFVAEPRPEPLMLEDCVGGDTLEEKAQFFATHGCIVVPRLFEGEQLARLQRAWRAAGESARAQWEEAKLHGVPPSPMDGIYYKNQQELNAQFPDLGSAGFGRKWFDVPRKDFYAEAIEPDGTCQNFNPPPVVDFVHQSHAHIF